MDNRKGRRVNLFFFFFRRYELCTVAIHLFHLKYQMKIVHLCLIFTEKKRDWKYAIFHEKNPRKIFIQLQRLGFHPARDSKATPLIYLYYVEISSYLVNSHGSLLKERNVIRKIYCCLNQGCQFIHLYNSGKEDVPRSSFLLFLLLRGLFFQSKISFCSFFLNIEYFSR